ncbi:MAG: transposase [Candidatus Omnitrophica bacterium]|nr:transposase [Candidatus Omnitrophota bacterium]
MRAGKKKRLNGVARKGYCSSLKRWFYGVREHLIFTPEGRIAFIVQIAGNRHDVNGLYALLKTTFQGHLLGDNAYWPRSKKRNKLAAQGITVTADTRSNWHIKNPPDEQVLLDTWRGRVERRIGLFDTQFHAARTLCRSVKHYHARRWTKVMTHNLSRHLNSELGKPEESLMHYHLAA